MRARWNRRRLGVLAAGVLVLGAAAAGAGALWLRARFYASLPRTSGEVALAGLGAPVTVERDALGVPVLRGATFDDVVRAQGFVHAQERFFQMDLFRRVAAGEVAALVGEGGVRIDRRTRPLRLRRVADELLERLDERERGWLASYAEGVAAGLADLGDVPPEYVLLGADPAPWSAADSLLAAFTMYVGQSLGARFEATAGALEDALPPELARFLLPETTRSDQLVTLAPADHVPLPIPGPDVVDLRDPERAALPPAPVEAPFETAPGSNAWALSGERTTHGGALVANDPHLEFGVPPVWFRNELRWNGGQALGLSLAGVPGVVIGSNGHVAWGFTNLMADQQDLVALELDPLDSDRYRVPGGTEPFEHVVELVEVRGGDPIELRVRVTRWGPVTTDAAEEPSDEPPRALAWTLLDADMVDVDLLGIAFARTLEDALGVLDGWQGAGFNAVVCDERGRVAWVAAGSLPRRIGTSGLAPRAWAEPGVGWDGSYAGPERPTVTEPPFGVVLSANQRFAPLEVARRVSRAWLPPDRAARIAELLGPRARHDEAGMLRLQLDTRSVVHDLYRDLALATARPDDADVVARARALVAAWDGTADVDETPFRVLRRFRRRVHALVLGPLAAPAFARDADFEYDWPLMEEPVRRLLEERPAHLVPPPHATWGDALAAAFRETARAHADHPDLPFDAPWGAENRGDFSHVMSGGLLPLGLLFDLPSPQLAGHTTTVRATDPRFGASMRMVVSPGREEHGLLHMPAGQSGHFLSPHYGDGHMAWAHGRATPFLAGEPVERLVLRPAD